MTHSSPAKPLKALLEEQSGILLDEVAIDMLHENFSIQSWLESIPTDQLTDLWYLAFPKATKMPDETDAIAALNVMLYLPDLHDQVQAVLETTFEISIDRINNTYIGYPNLQYVVDELQAM